jgi:UDP-glucose 4-epimerase
MELCRKHDVQRLIVLSTFHIYGAHPHNHIPIFEDEPLRAAQTFPQLGDAVQLDSLASNWVYRHRKLRTAVLRPTNIVGPNIRNAISTYLRRPTLVCMLGYSPMWQFIHERDMVGAILTAFEHDTVGVYNVAGRGAIPLVDALKLTGAPVVPIPPPVAELALRLGRTVFPTVPPYLLDFFKYPCVISDEKFRADHDFEPQVTVEEAIRSTVRGA